jgi:hypothetical protein
MRRWLIGVAIAVLLVQVAGLAIWFMKPETPAFLEKARRLRPGMSLEEANAIFGSDAMTFESTDNEAARCCWEVANLAVNASLDGDRRLASASYTDFLHNRTIVSLFDETLFERMKYDFGFGEPINDIALR